MNRTTAIALLALATLMTAGSAGAQSAVLKVDVPFNFTVSGTSVLAGSYTFVPDSMDPNVLVIEDRATMVRARAFAQRGSIGPGREDGLIFHQYGGKYFLSEVHFGFASNGIFLPVTRIERQARKVSGKEDLALVAGH